MSAENQFKTLETQADFNRHELLSDVAEASAQHLIKKHGLDELVAADLGNAVADFLCEHWKGQSVYIPADEPFKISQRDLKIYQRMARGNAPELAREFGISTVHVYQVYRRMLVVQRAKLQPGLFPEVDQTKAD